jgi:hypothetical protein
VRVERVPSWSGDVLVVVPPLQPLAVLVGERPAPKWDGRPETQLTGTAFRRLARAMFTGFSNSWGRYLVTLCRCNALGRPGDRWGKKETAEARDRGAAIRDWAGARQLPVVALGRRAADALGLDLLPFRVGHMSLALPHPSGRCREWNAPNAWPQAGESFRVLLGLSRPQGTI